MAAPFFRQTTHFPESRSEPPWEVRAKQAGCNRHADPPGTSGLRLWLWRDPPRGVVQGEAREKWPE
jgi:hypothetical protein